MKEDFYRLYRGEGAGSNDSVDDAYEADEFQTKDERSPTRTTFFERDVDRLDVSERRKQKLKSMLRRQEGQQHGEVYSTDRQNREQQNRGEWKRRMVTTFASQLSLTDAQTERALHLVENELSMNEFAYYAKEQVILGVINVVAREDGRWIEEESKFRELMSHAGIEDDNRPDMDSMKTLRRMVRERI